MARTGPCPSLVWVEIMGPLKPPQTTKDYMYHHPPPSGTVVERMNAGQFVACRSRVSGQASSMAQQSLHHFAELLLRPPTMPR